MRVPMWKHIYYFVPPCPKCGSRKTGRYIRSPLTGEGYTKEASLKNGELVRFSFEVPVNNGYCMSCGYEWPVRVETKLWSYTKIREEQIARGTDILYEKILSKKTKSKWDVGRYFHERYRNIEEVENQKEKDCVCEPEIIDSRKRDKIELLYADETLIEQVRNVQRV